MGQSSKQVLAWLKKGVVLKNHYWGEAEPVHKAPVHGEMAEC
jgi:hypothetical protein